MQIDAESRLRQPRLCDHESDIAQQYPEFLETRQMHVRRRIGLLREGLVATAQADSITTGEERRLTSFVYRRFELFDVRTALADAGHRVGGSVRARDE